MKCETDFPDGIRRWGEKGEETSWWQQVWNCTCKVEETERAYTAHLCYFLHCIPPKFAKSLLLRFFEGFSSGVFPSFAPLSASTRFWNIAVRNWLQPPKHYWAQVGRLVLDLKHHSSFTAPPSMALALGIEEAASRSSPIGWWFSMMILLLDWTPMSTIGAT